MMQNTLITGAKGMVGSYADFGIKMGEKELDVTDLAAVRAVCYSVRPEVVIHLAAITDPSVCEADPARAYLVNAAGAYHVALAAREFGARIVYVSTNAVFDGGGEKPFGVFDTPRPQNVYGYSKYAGECLVRGVLPNALVVRTGWIFGGGLVDDKKFVGKMMRLFKNGVAEVRAASDVRGSPTYGKDLFSSIQRLISAQAEGVVHSVNKGIASRYEIACLMKELLQTSTRVVPVPATSFGGSPVYNEALEGQSMRPWQEALREYLEKELIPWP